MNKSRLAESMRVGKTCEVRFKRAAEKLGFSVEKSSHQDDRYNHVDFWLSFVGNGRWGVDVKGSNLPEYIWCEFKNVAGEDGWMYGKADIIAFDMPEVGGYVIVGREELKNYCEKETSETVVSAKINAYKKRYTRKDRSDVITYLTLRDIQSLDSYRVWYYDTEY